MVLHGVKRRAKDQPVDPEVQKAAAQKAELYRQLQDGVLERRGAGLLDEESLGLSAKLLQLNPDVYTAWNFRKEILDHLLAGAEDVRKKEMLDEDLKLVEKALHANPKSYGAWYHRKWVVEKGFCSLDREMKLCNMLLKMDERNFHGWDYRRFVVATARVEDADELKYTTEKIESNFSNYSAWHNRSKLLLRMNGGCGIPGKVIGNDPGVASPDRDRGVGDIPPPRQLLDEELELVKQALFTEPDDQSGWLYHRWLIGQVMGVADVDAGHREQVIKREADSCRELLEVEPGSKWAKLTLTRLLTLGGESMGEVACLLSELEQIDPYHAAYYAGFPKK